MSDKPIPDMSDEELDIYIEGLLKEPAFRGMAAHHLQWILRSNPNYPEIIRADHAAWEARVRAFAELMEPIISDLRAADVPATSDDWMHKIDLEAYERAIPILVKWLPVVKDDKAKEWVVRCLTVPLARPYLQELIAEYQRMRDQGPSDARWALNNAIGFQIGPDVADVMVRLAQDRTYKWDRTEIVRNLPKIKDNERVFKILVDLLDDETVDWTALWALRLLGDERARCHLERFLDHPDKHMRGHAKKGLEKLDKRRARLDAKQLPEGQRSQPATKVSARAARKEPRPWPSGLPHDALVALTFANLVELETLSGMSRKELWAMRGIGIKTIERIELELDRHNLPPLTD